jgi:hypothetical protein
MRAYSIVDLLVDTYYAPQSLSRRFNGGIINHAEKREDVYPPEGYEAFAIRYRNSSRQNNRLLNVGGF